MNHDEFRAFRSACRKRNGSQEIQHAGRRWAVGRHGVDRLDSSAGPAPAAGRHGRNVPEPCPRLSGAPGTALHVAPGAPIQHRQLTRHVGIFGATGTGKTTTAAAIAERAPCPVLLLDAKGDLEALGDRLVAPRMAIDALGAEFVARALDLSEPQAGALHIALAWAEDCGRRVASLADLRALLLDMLQRDMTAEYGLVSPVSVAAVQRALVRLEQACPGAFGDGAPDWRDATGITVIGCRHIAGVPGLYGAFAAHVLDSLYRGLGELGDTGAPGLMLMIDESHLIFDGAPAGIMRRIDQVTRLIRSKGVGVVYITQAPSDLPDSVLAQLGTRVQHGLRATTPAQVKAAKAAADTAGVAAATVLGLGIGQAVIGGRVVQVTAGARHFGQVDSFALAPAPMRRAAHDQPAPRRRPRPWWRTPMLIVLLIWAGLAISL